MLLKHRISKLVSYTCPLRICGQRFLVHNKPLSTVAVESPVVADQSKSAESPELPSWVKSTDTKNSSAAAVSDDEDFVIPSLASWIENQKLVRDESTETKQSIIKEKPVADIDKISEFLKKRYPSPDILVQALDECDVNVSSGLVSQVLRRFSNEWVQAFGVFTWAKSQTGYRHSPELYNTMVDVLGKCREFDVMWELVQEMNKLGGYVTIDTMSKIIRRLAKARKYSEAVEAFRGLERFSVTRDANALNILMDALVKGNSVEHASEAFLEFKDRIPCNIHTFNVLIHGYCKARKFEDAWRTMDEIRKHGFNPDVVSYTSLVEAYCREKDFRRVDSILEEMQQNGCNPNAVTYTLVMHALGKARQVEQALAVYDKMKSNGCVPDTKFYSSLMFILSKAGRFKDANEIFEDMTVQGASPDVLTYNTMISCACDHSQEETALRLLKQMEEESCRPDIETYTPLLKMCCRKNRMKVLGFLLHHMVKNDVSIDIATYILLVRGLCRSGKLEEACSFFEEAVSKGMIPKDSTYKALVEELEVKGMAEAKGKIEKLMSQLKV